MNTSLCSDAFVLLCSLVLFCFFAPQAAAQQWLSEVPEDKRQDPTINDLRQAFEKYYREHPVDLRRDKLEPTFRFEGAQEQKERADVDAYKMFRRWEWLVVPRSYPSGRLDLEQLAILRGRVRQTDDELTSKLSARTALLFRKRWKPLGPFDAIDGTNLGRVNCIEFDPKSAKIIYLCTPDGGIWKSFDGGATWSPISDFEPTLSTGDIAIDPMDTKVLYVATSDAFGYGVPFWGGTYSVGVMKSTDGGSTWRQTDLNWTVTQNRTIRRLVMHPTNSKILLAATSAGLYRTDDGGKKWSQILSESTYDVEFQQDNSGIAYATTNQVLKSHDAGASFGTLTASCSHQRYNIEIARSNPKVLYTLCSDGTVQKSPDEGVTWNAVAAPGAHLFGYYDNVLSVSPVHEEIVYVAGLNIKRSTDGGITWDDVPVAGHPDNHAIKFAPGSSSTLLSGNDGGLFKSSDSAASWTSVNKGLAITQFYRLGISWTNPNIMVAGAQDNGNVKHDAGKYTNLTGSDGTQGFIDWSNSDLTYASIQNGVLYRIWNGGDSFKEIRTPGASGAWITPWCQDPVVANTIYAATDKVYKSKNQGDTWEPVSGALAWIEKFTVLEVARSNTSVIYAGSGRRLHRTTNGGRTWTDITSGLPVNTNYLTDIAIHDANPDIAYVTFSGYVAGEKVYRTLDGGGSWENISGKLPNMPVNTIAYQKSAKNGLYIGTDAGVYYKNDGMKGWVPYKSGLPNVIVNDLQIHHGAKTITAATYGRGIWQAQLN